MMLTYFLRALLPGAIFPTQLAVPWPFRLCRTMRTARQYCGVVISAPPRRAPQMSAADEYVRARRSAARGLCSHLAGHPSPPPSPRLHPPGAAPLPTDSSIPPHPVPRSHGSTCIWADKVRSRPTHILNPIITCVEDLRASGAPALSLRLCSFNG